MRMNILLITRIDERFPIFETDFWYFSKEHNIIRKHKNEKTYDIYAHIITSGIRISKHQL